MTEEPARDAQASAPSAASSSDVPPSLWAPQAAPEDMQDAAPSGVAQEGSSRSMAMSTEAEQQLDVLFAELDVAGDERLDIDSTRAFFLAIGVPEYPPPELFGKFAGQDGRIDRGAFGGLLRDFVVQANTSIEDLFRAASEATFSTAARQAMTEGDQTHPPDQSLTDGTEAYELVDVTGACVVVQGLQVADGHSTGMEFAPNPQETQLAVPTEGVATEFEAAAGPMAETADMGFPPQQLLSSSGDKPAMPCNGTAPGSEILASPYEMDSGHPSRHAASSNNTLAAGRGPPAQESDEYYMESEVYRYNQQQTSWPSDWYDGRGGDRAPDGFEDANWTEERRTESPIDYGDRHASAQGWTSGPGNYAMDAASSYSKNGPPPWASSVGSYRPERNPEWTQDRQQQWKGGKPQQQQQQQQPLSQWQHQWDGDETMDRPPEGQWNARRHFDPGPPPGTHMPHGQQGQQRQQGMHAAPSMPGPHGNFGQQNMVPNQSMQGWHPEFSQQSGYPQMNMQAGFRPQAAQMMTANQSGHPGKGHGCPQNNQGHPSEKGYWNATSMSYGGGKQGGKQGGQQFGNQGGHQFGNQGGHQFGNQGCHQFGNQGGHQCGNQGGHQFGSQGGHQCGGSQGSNHGGNQGNPYWQGQGQDSNQDFNPELMRWQPAIRALGNHAQYGQWQQALELLRAARGSDNALPVDVYKAAVSVCERSRQWQAALSVLCDVWRDGKQPDLETFDIAANACHLSGQWQAALQILEVSRQSQSRPSVGAAMALLSGGFPQPQQPQQHQQQQHQQQRQHQWGNALKGLMKAQQPQSQGKGKPPAAAAGGKGKGKHATKSEPKAKGKGEQPANRLAQTPVAPKAPGKAAAPKAQPKAQPKVPPKAPAKATASEPKSAPASKAVSPAASTPSEFVIHVDRTPQAPKLGIEADFSDRTVLRIHNIGPGVLQQWNDERPLSQRIQKGDAVVRVNGKEGSSQQLADELKTAETLNILVEKSAGKGAPAARIEVQLARTPQALPLGLEVSFEKQSLEIEVIDKEGLIAEWNYHSAKAQNNNKVVVQPGDRIVGVNDRKYTSSALLAEELRQAKVLKIYIQRGTPPRS